MRAENPKLCCRTSQHMHTTDTIHIRTFTPFSYSSTMWVMSEMFNKPKLKCCYMNMSQKKKHQAFSIDRRLIISISGSQLKLEIFICGNILYFTVFFIFISIRADCFVKAQEEKLERFLVSSNSASFTFHLSSFSTMYLWNFPVFNFMCLCFMYCFEKYFGCWCLNFIFCRKCVW